MSEVSNLVSWDQAEDLGKVPFSDWVYPMSSLEAVGHFASEGGIVTNDVIKELADGRPQHLVMLQYPEGYKAVQVVDSETGEVLTDGKYNSCYGGVWGACDCGHSEGGPFVSLPFLGKTGVGVGEGRVLSALPTEDAGVDSSTKPTGVDKNDPDYEFRIRTGVSITPMRREIAAYAEGLVDCLPGALLKWRVEQKEDRRPTGELTTWLGNGAGQVNLYLNSEGQVSRLSVNRDGLLMALGANIPVFLSYKDHYWANVTDSKDRSYVLDALADVLGLGNKWQGLDLKLSAANLYRRMGERCLDPSSVLVPLD